MFSNSERVLGAMIASIGKHLEIRGDINFSQIGDALISNHDWSIAMTHSFLVDSNYEMPEVVTETFGILDMWRVLRTSFAALPNAEQATLLGKLGVDEMPDFEGFDANNDDHYGVAAHLLSIGRYEELEDLPLNSHSIASLLHYKSMVVKFNAHDRVLGGGLDANQLEDILT